MRILISGAGGFLGANATYYFENKGYEVISASRNPNKSWRLENSKSTKLELDITDAQAVDAAFSNHSPEAVINYAAYGAYPGRETDAAFMRKTNVEGVKNLLASAKKSGVKKFVQVGSSSEYGPKLKPMFEADSCSPQDDYAKTKFEATNLTLAAAKDGLDAVVLRPFSPFGAWDDKKRLIPTLILSALEGKPAKLSTPTPKRDFFFSDDFSQAAELAISKDGISGEIFNIGSGAEISVGEVAKEINSLVKGSKPPEWGAPNPRAEPTHWQADISKAKKLLSWEPRYLLKEGLSQTIAWFSSNKRYYQS